MADPRETTFRQILKFGAVLAAALVLGCSGAKDSAPRNSTPQGPAITSLTATPSLIGPGERSILKFQFSDGTGTLDQGIGSVQSGAECAVILNNTTTYTLTVTDANGVATQAAVTVAVSSDVGISILPLNDLPVTIGGHGQFLIQVLRLGQESGDIVASLQGAPAGTTGTCTIPAGSMDGEMEVQVAPYTPAGTYQVMLSATDGIHSHSTPFNLVVTTPDLPVITSLLADSYSITAGSTAHFTAVFANGTGLLDYQNIESGSPLAVAPIYNQSFTLTVTNGDGKYVSATSGTILVNQPEGLGLVVRLEFDVLATYQSAGSVFLTGPSGYARSLYVPESGFLRRGAYTGLVSGLAPGTYTVEWRPGGEVFPSYTELLVDLAQGTELAYDYGHRAPTLTASSNRISSGSGANLTAYLLAGQTGTIDNGVGAVTSGVPVQVNPTQTTTYTLTVDGSKSPYPVTVTVPGT